MTHPQFGEVAASAMAHNARMAAERATPPRPPGLDALLGHVAAHLPEPVTSVALDSLADTLRDCKGQDTPAEAARAHLGAHALELAAALRAHRDQNGPTYDERTGPGMQRAESLLRLHASRLVGGHNATELAGAYDAAAHHDEVTADDIRSALDFNHGSASPTLYALRDIIVTMPGATAEAALAGARVLLAAHTRELAELGRAAARDRNTEMRARGDRSRVAYCGGMDAVTRLLNRHADDLDAAAVDPEAAR